VTILPIEHLAFSLALIVVKYYHGSMEMSSKKLP